eukprot:m.380821 g.380821  ORF g.380821 m.380821 type:complete len:226 (+) comp20963_c0_seq3:638-1315(+)
MGLVLGDAQLEREDVKLLSGPYWLNDAVIAFAMEYFTSHQFRTAADMIFVSPSVVQLVALISDPTDLTNILEGANLSSNKLIFFPLNDHDSPTTRGGTHWSLLVHTKTGFYLLDSIQSSTQMRKAELIAERLHAAFGLGNNTKKMVSPVPCPQQPNGYDCGVAAVAFAHAVATSAQRNNYDVNAKTIASATHDACVVDGEINFSIWREYLLHIVHEIEILQCGKD